MAGEERGKMIDFFFDFFFWYRVGRMGWWSMPQELPHKDRTASNLLIEKQWKFIAVTTLLL